MRSRLSSTCVARFSSRICRAGGQVRLVQRDGLAAARPAHEVEAIAALLPLHRHPRRVAHAGRGEGQVRLRVGLKLEVFLALDLDHVDVEGRDDRVPRQAIGVSVELGPLGGHRVDRHVLDVALVHALDRDAPGIRRPLEHRTHRNRLDDLRRPRRRRPVGPVLLAVGRQLRRVTPFGGPHPQVVLVHERLQPSVGGADVRRAVDQRVADLARVRADVTGEAALVGVEADRLLAVREFEGAERELAPFECSIGRNRHRRSKPVVVEEQGARAAGRVGEHEFGPVIRLVPVPEAVAAGHPLRRHRSPAYQRVDVPRKEALRAMIAGDVELLGIGLGRGTEAPARDDEEEARRAGCKKASGA